MNPGKTIFLAGARRGVGRAIAEQLAAQKNDSVYALLRNRDVEAELSALGLKLHWGDALNYGTVEQAIAAASPVDVIISTIGGLPEDQQGDRADYLGNKHLIDAAVACQVKRFILISSIGAGSSAEALPEQAMSVLKPVLIEKEKAEAHLLASGLIYTVIRPGGLRTAPATHQAALTDNPLASGIIHRADVAELVCSALSNPETYNRVFSAVDPSLA